MKRISNCILIHQDKVLLIKKPRRGWYAIPGGKMEQAENIRESAIREFKEETALELKNPKLAGVFTFCMYEEDRFIEEWMMFTFTSTAFDGELTKYSDEGIIEWVEQENVLELPMAEGDRKIFEHALSSNGILYGSFAYTKDFELIDMRFEPSTP